MKIVTGALTLAVTAVIGGACPASAQISDAADAALWAALNGCKLRMSMEQLHPQAGR